MKRINYKRQTANDQELLRFKTLIQKKKLKWTKEREIIFAEIHHMKEHFDADSIYQNLKNKNLGISRDTVYRNLPLLLESGVLQKSVGDSRRDYFERVSSKGHHDHMVCIECGHVIEFNSKEIEAYQDEVCAKFKFQLIFHDHRIFGRCFDCQTKK